MTPRLYHLNLYIVSDKVKAPHLGLLLIYVDIAHACGCFN